jgi:hypothetical protein
VMVGRYTTWGSTRWVCQGACFFHMRCGHSRKGPETSDILARALVTPLEKRLSMMWPNYTLLLIAVVLETPSTAMTTTRKQGRRSDVPALHHAFCVLHGTGELSKHQNIESPSRTSQRAAWPPCPSASAPDHLVEAAVVPAERSALLLKG